MKFCQFFSVQIQRKKRHRAMWHKLIEVICKDVFKNSQQDILFLKYQEVDVVQIVKTRLNI